MRPDSSHEVVRPDDLIIRVDAWWLWRYANDFLDAFASFPPPSGRFSPVPSYLACRSIELSLKAFLFTVGYKKRDRKRLGHDIEFALETAEVNGLTALLSVTNEDREIVRAANRLYRNKEFEYFESLETVYDSPAFDLGELNSFAKRLHAAIEGPVRESVCE